MDKFFTFIFLASFLSSFDAKDFHFKIFKTFASSCTIHFDRQSAQFNVNVSSTFFDFCFQRQTPKCVTLILPSFTANISFELLDTLTHANIVQLYHNDTERHTRIVAGMRFMPICTVKIAILKNNLDLFPTVGYPANRVSAPNFLIIQYIFSKNSTKFRIL